MTISKYFKSLLSYSIISCRGLNPVIAISAAGLESLMIFFYEFDVQFIQFLLKNNKY